MSRTYDDERSNGDQVSRRASSAVPAAGLSNQSVARMLSVQRLEQSMPYVGPLLNYLNPGNQAARLLFDGLTQEQESLLTGIFGNSLATSVIRINYNSEIGAMGGYPRTSGNIIHVPWPTISDAALIHEAAHVWQHQNGIAFGYALSALRSQAIAEIFTGKIHGAYSYELLEKYRIPWRYWNAEQQADWIEHNKRLPDRWWLDALEPDPPGNPELPTG